MCHSASMFTGCRRPIQPINRTGATLVAAGVVVLMTGMGCGSAGAPEPEHDASPRLTAGSGSGSAVNATACRRPAPVPHHRPELRVYFWCVDQLRPVVRSTSAEADLYVDAARAVVEGPNAIERHKGYFGGLYDPRLNVTVVVSRGIARVNISRKRLLVERYLANATYFEKSMARTLNGLRGVKDTVITIGGRPTCEVDPEAMCDQS